MKYKREEHKLKGKEAHETKFYNAKKDYNFGVYKMDPSVNVMTKTKTDF